MTLVSKTRNYTVHEVKATSDGKIPEIEKEIAMWSGRTLQIKITRK